MNNDEFRHKASGHYPSFILTYNINTGDLSKNNIGIYPNPMEVDTQEFKMILFGSPIVKNIVNKKDVISKVLLHRKLDQSYIKTINGEFLIILIDKKKNTLSIANDRFSSIQLYYYQNKKEVILSFAYLDILKIVKNKIGFKMRGDIVFEYLWFRRVYGESTYDSLVKFIKPARILILSSKGKDEIVYYMPNFGKNNNSLRQNSKILASSISESMSRKLSDANSKKVGLFLSGGMDTRVLLSAFNKTNFIDKLQYFTLGYSKSGEYRVAKQLTKSHHSNHHFIELAHDYYDRYWRDKLYISGGLFNQYSIIFAGHSDLISPHANLLFHGHGLDYMFQGMYLPTSTMKIFGKSTYFKTIDNLNGLSNFSSYFSNNSPYRAWRVKVGDYVKPEYKDEIIEGLYSRIESVADEGMSICSDNYDLWEYMLIHTPSRHYSQTDVTGISTNGEQRKIANDNDLFNFYTSLPIKHRIHARVMRGALKELSPEFSRIISANTGYKINASPASLTAHFIWYKLLRTVTNNQKFSHPKASSRTWPDIDNEVRIRPRLREDIIKLQNSEHLRYLLPFFDFNKLEKDIDQWINKGRPGGGLFLTSLLTIDNMMKEFL
jgi:hypothetical protein